MGPPKRCAASGGPQLPSWEPLGSLLGVSWGPLGASWEPLGASWEPLGDHLGTPWGVFGPSLGLLELLERPRRRKKEQKEIRSMGLEAKRVTKRYPKSIPEASKNAFGMHPGFNRPLRAFLHRFGIKNHEVEECRKNVHPSNTSMFTVFYKGFLRFAFFAFA